MRTEFLVRLSCVDTGRSVVAARAIVLVGLL